MVTISDYHRPSTLSEAVALVGQADRNRVVIGGGTVVGGTGLPSGTEVVDIQTAVPGTIEQIGDRVEMGAMARVQDVIDDTATPHLIVEVAKREGPNTLRNAATIGGTIATADPESELLAGLLVHEAVVTMMGPDGEAELPIADLLADRSVLSASIITSVSVAMEGQGASARTGRTPADTSIVAAVARRGPTGLLLALTGVAATPILVDPADLQSLDPPPDFRGSAEYRLELARILSGRVLAELDGAA